jgi:hypothetical protein
MELTSGQRKALFALVVAALTALGIYMFVPGARAARGNGGTPATAHSPAPTSPVSPSAAPAASGTGPAAGGAPPAATTPSAPDIYQWLPFSQSELASAAAVVTQFGNAYGTFSYSENAAAYVSSMRNLITPGLSQVLEGAFSVPGVAAQRDTKEQVSTGSAVISSLRAFGPSSMTFVVTISQEIIDTSGRSRVSGRYAVTVTGAGPSWQVNDIELASAGNS